MTDLQKGEKGVPTTLVVGGAGFLGSHLCDRFIREGHEVICMDSLLTGQMENIRHLLSHARFVFIRHDVTQPIDWSSLIRDKVDNYDALKIDYVLHLAAPDNPEDYMRHRIHTLKIGALGCYHTLGLAKAHGSVFLLASTPEVYEGPQAKTYRGRVSPPGPRRTYDEAKRFVESIATAYYREHNVKVRIARIFNTYGARMPVGDEQSLPSFVVQALQGRPLTIHGDGRQTRSYCYVSDLVEGLYRLLLSQETEPVDLGNPGEFSVLKLAETIIELTGSESRVVFEPRTVSEPVRSRPDIAKAREALNWYPRIGLFEGIKRVIPYFRVQMADRWLHHPELGWRVPFHAVDERYVQNN